LPSGQPAGGQAVDIGPVLPWDVAASAEFSPDGSKVIARYSNGSTWILPVNGGPGEPFELSTNMFVASWQRLPR
jgi:hypothetical protein